MSIRASMLPGLLLLVATALTGCGSSTADISITTPAISTSSLAASSSLHLSSEQSPGPCTSATAPPRINAPPTLTATNPTTPAGPTVAFGPNTVAVASGRCRVVALTISNPDEQAATATIVLYPDPGLTVSQSSTTLTVPGRGSVAWPIGLTRTAAAAGAASIAAIITLTSSTRATTETATLPVTLEPAQTVAAPISVNQVVGTASLIEYQTVDSFFTLTNTTGNAQTLTDVVATFPTFVCVEFQPDQPGESAAQSTCEKGTGASDGRLTILTGPRRVAPGDSLVLHLRLTAPHGVQPGNGLVVVSGRAQDVVDGAMSTLVTSQNLTFSVLGQSDILGVLGVPSLILVPGLVVLVVLFFLFGYVWPGRKTGTPETLPDLSKTGLWVLALLPSLAFPFLYPTMTRLLTGRARDYRQIYGLSDILIVWALAVLFAIFVWIVVVLARGGLQRYVLIQPDDGPPLVLAKLRRRLRRNRYWLTAALYQEKNVYLVTRRRDNKYLVIPGISWSPTDNQDSDSLATALNKPTPRNIKKQLDKKKIQVRFVSVLDHPTVVAPEGLTNVRGPLNLVTRAGV